MSRISIVFFLPFVEKLFCQALFFSTRGFKIIAISSSQLVAMEIKHCSVFACFVCSTCNNSLNRTLMFTSNVTCRSFAPTRALLLNGQLKFTHKQKQKQSVKYAKYRCKLNVERVTQHTQCLMSQN